MYKLVPREPVRLKTYWCSDLEVARQVAGEIEARFDCDCEIVDMPCKNSWATCYPLRGFTKEQLDDAVCHAKDNILKIKDHQEIFCLAADDIFWQRHYLHGRDQDVLPI